MRRSRLRPAGESFGFALRRRNLFGSVWLANLLDSLCGDGTCSVPSGWRILWIRLRRRNLFGSVWLANSLDSLAASRDSVPESCSWAALEGASLDDSLMKSNVEARLTHSKIGKQKAQAAKLLGILPCSLRYKIDKLKIK
jgi:hypothetical protein